MSLMYILCKFDETVSLLKCKVENSTVVLDFKWNLISKMITFTKRISFHLETNRLYWQYFPFSLLVSLFDKHPQTNLINFSFWTNKEIPNSVNLYFRNCQGAQNM